MLINILADAQTLTANWRSQNGEIDHFDDANIQQNIVWEFPWVEIENLLNRVDEDTFAIRFYLGSKNDPPQSISDYVLLATLVEAKEDNNPNDDTVAEQDDTQLIYQSSDGNFEDIESQIDESGNLSVNRAKEYLRKYKNVANRKKVLKNFATPRANKNIKAFRFDIGIFYFLKSVYEPTSLKFSLGLKNRNHGTQTNPNRSATLIMLTAPTKFLASQTKTNYKFVFHLQGASRVFDYSEICPPACGGGDLNG